MRGLFTSSGATHPSLTDFDDSAILSGLSRHPREDALN
jgi:hypothetical protein